MLTFNSNGNWFHFTPKNPVEIFLLKVPEERHAAGEERNVPEISESDCQSAVTAENANGWEGTDDAHPKRDHVSDRSDCNTDGSFRHHVTHSLRHRQLYRCSSPSSQHHERVIDANTC